MDLCTFISFDCTKLPKPPVWHVAIAIYADVRLNLLIPVAMWTHNDYRAALQEANGILGDAGDIAKGKWWRKTDDGLDLYRASTVLEAQIAKAAIELMPPLPPFIDPEWLKEFEVNDGRAELAADGIGNKTIGTDGAGAARISRTKVTAERVDDP